MLLTKISGFKKRDTEGLFASTIIEVVFSCASFLEGL